MTYRLEVTADVRQGLVCNCYLWSLRQRNSYLRCIVIYCKQWNSEKFCMPYSITLRGVFGVCNCTHYLELPVHSMSVLKHPFKT
ncbi:hypothetical protein GDO78_000433 [Eleutherodactylus coqui]|uniref:Uncharacterized protein n=1 Tax=Eleutherodactylus coqui TaxID=57060 RepID=A0A8J6KFF2_ELECQ|nr:hypothetical protein GDO78_000433 [Eleutherodactylus coqui]